MRSRKLHFAYFDLECRPGHWIGGDYVSKVITAASVAVDSGKPEVRTHYDYMPGEIALWLTDILLDADVVVGHYIRAFDLPLLNGELLRNKYKALPPITALDTKIDLRPAGGRSKSQKNLGSQMGLKEPKVDVTIPEWEGFNARYPGFEDKVIERVVGDVKQNRALHRKLATLGWLTMPKVWQPQGKPSEGYEG